MTMDAARRRTSDDLGSRPGAEIALLWLEGLLALGALGGATGFLLLDEDLLGEATSRLPVASPMLADIALGLVNGVCPPRCCSVRCGDDGGRSGATSSVVGTPE